MIWGKYGITEKQIEVQALLVQDLERAISEFWSARDANDVELLTMHNGVVRLKKAASRLESKKVDLQGALSANENLKKELDELHYAHTDLIEENKQLRSEKSSIEE